MINKILSLIAVVAVTLGFASCNDDNWAAKQNRTGSLSLSSLGIDVNTEASRASDIDVTDYIIEISQEGELVGQAYRFGSMPEVITLPVGTYTLTVKSHEVQKAEWSNPYYLGSKEFTVVEDKISEIGTVQCYFSNVKVTIVYEETLKKAMGNDCKVTVVVNNATLEFGKDETRSGYFEAIEGSTTMVAIFQGSVDGNYRTMTQDYTDVKPGQHYTITYSLKTGDPSIPDNPDPENTGSINTGNGSDENSGISIATFINSDITDDVNGSVDPSEETEEVIVNPGERPGTEEPEEPDTPENPDTPDTPDNPTPGGDETDAITITSETLTFGTPVLVTADLEAKMDIHSDYGIANFVVTIDSDNANFKSAVADLLPLTFDLANPGDKADAFASLGFPVGNDVIGAKDLVFDITTFMPLLKAYPGNHSFTLSITDAEGNNLTKVLKLQV